MLAVDLTSVLIISVAAIVAYVAVMWVALAFWVVRDARRRSNSILFALFAALLGFIPPLLGPLLYYVVRPPRTLDEERQLELEEQALLEMEQEEPTTTACGACGREIERDFVLCPHCHTQFAKRCTACHRVLRLGWEVCPYCAEDVGLPLTTRASRSERLSGPATATATPSPTQPALQPPAIAPSEAASSIG